MVQLENEYGSVVEGGGDKVYLQHLNDVVRKHLGQNVVVYTTGKPI